MTGYVDAIRHRLSRPDTGDNAPYHCTQVRFREGTAGLVQVEGLRLHDLRHSFAAGLVQGGTSLYVVQKLLGHHAPTMTMRYAHLADAPLRAATESAVERVAGSGS